MLKRKKKSENSEKLVLPMPVQPPIPFETTPAQPSQPVQPQPVQQVQPSQSVQPQPVQQVQPSQPVQPQPAQQVQPSYAQPQVRTTTQRENPFVGLMKVLAEVDERMSLIEEQIDEIIKRLNMIQGIQPMPERRIVFPKFRGA